MGLSPQNLFGRRLQYNGIPQDLAMESLFRGHRLAPAGKSATFSVDDGYPLGSGGRTRT